MSTDVRTSNQSRASTKIVIGFMILLALAYFGKNAYESRQLNGTKFTPLIPGVVNLVGVDTKSGGYHIVVANGIAQLVQSPNSTFGPGEMNANQADSSDSDAEKKRVPLRALIKTLQGDSSSVTEYVERLNDMKDEDLPPSKIEVDWNASTLKKAISGDAKLKTKLEDDLNTHLDGTPLTTYRPNTFQNGIVIRLPVTLRVGTEQGTKEVNGIVRIPFQTALMRALEAKVSDKTDIPPQVQAGFYAEVGQTYLDNPTRRQDVAKALSGLISKDNEQRLEELPQTVLDSVQILANDSLITRASYAASDAGKGQQFDMEVDVTDEGRKRLWQYSRGHLNDQILLVVDGIAVAAPRIGTELSQSNFSIKNMPDERIVKDAVDKINGQSKQQI